MAIIWRDSEADVDWAQLSELYRLAPLGNKSPDWLRSAFSNSRYKFFGSEGGAIIAAGRAVADGFDCSYICDIAIHPDHQGRGLGKEMMARLVAASRGHRKIILYAVPGREGFYRNFGFRRMRTAMAIFADEQSAVANGYID